MPLPSLLGPGQKKAADVLTPEFFAARHKAQVEAETQAKSEEAHAKKMADLTVRQQALETGLYKSRLDSTAGYYSQLKRVESMERQVAMQHRYGRAGALAVSGISRLGGPAMAMGLGIVSGARQGFQGTVEMNRFHNEIGMINRELAGAFVPVLRETVAALKFLRRGLQSLGPNGQNALMAGGLAVGIYGLYRTHSFVSNFGKAAATQAAGSAVGSTAGNVAAGATGGALTRWGGRALRGAGAIGKKTFWPAMLGVGFNDAFLGWGGEETWYSKSRRAGHPSGLAWLSAIGQAGVSEMSFGMADRKIESGLASGAARRGLVYGMPADAASAARERDRVTLAQAGFEGVGSAYERVSDAAAMVGAQDTDDDTTLGDILKWLEKQVNKFF